MPGTSLMTPAAPWWRAYKQRWLVSSLTTPCLSSPITSSSSKHYIHTQTDNVRQDSNTTNSCHKEVAKSLKVIWNDALEYGVCKYHWSLLNRFHTEQGHCGACRTKWRLTDISVSLWRDPDDVSHCRILSPDKTKWRLILATLCRWRRCFVADQLWLLKRIQEEEVPISISL